MTKRFFFVSLGVLALAISFHLGTRMAGAQSGGDVAVAYNRGNNELVFTTTGDVYEVLVSGADITSWYRGNMFESPNTAEKASWGEIKSKFR